MYSVLCFLELDNEKLSLRKAHYKYNVLLLLLKQTENSAKHILCSTEVNHTRHFWVNYPFSMPFLHRVTECVLTLFRHYVSLLL